MNCHSTTFILILTASSIIFTGCNSTNHNRQEPEEEKPDTLRVATLSGPTSYFSYRGQQMGFDYENVCQFAKDENMVLDLKIAPSLSKMLSMLGSGEIDLIAYPIPKIEEYSNSVTYCGPKEITWQVLVQPHGKGRVSDVTELVGKTVYVEKDSKFEYRLNNLNNELGGGISVVPISRDTLIADDLIEMVSRGEIPLTVVDSDIAELNQSYFPGLDINMKVSFEQYSSWAVRQDRDTLASKLNRWRKQREKSALQREIYKKYFEISKQAPLYNKEIDSLCLNPGRPISPYDALFKRYGRQIGYDWELLAAIGFNESRFDHNQVSWAGASGVMQLMPATARSLDIDDISTPDRNIYAASKLIQKLDESLSSKVSDPEERRLFVVAAYNSGLGHIFDAIALAEKNGLDPQIWQGHVSEAALLKSRPKYYNDPVVKNGYFRARETVEFVDNVMTVYGKYKDFTSKK